MEDDQSDSVVERVSAATHLITAGPSTTTSTATMIEECKYRVVAGLEVSNATKHPLISEGCYIHYGRIRVPPRSINPGTKETFVAQKTGYVACGTSGVSAWKIGTTNLHLYVLWSAPFNFDFYENKLAIGIISKEKKPDLAKTTFWKMYNRNEEWFKLGAYYRNLIPIRIDEKTGKFRAEGIMGSTHKCVIQVTLLPLQEDDVAPSIKETAFSKPVTKPIAEGKQKMSTGLISTEAPNLNVEETSAAGTGIDAQLVTENIRNFLSVCFIKGVEVIGEKEFTVLTESLNFEWQGYGFELRIPEGSLPFDKREVRVNIKASPAGQYQLPEDSDLLSPIFWISASCKFTKPVTMKIQHCALIEDEKVSSGLCFVSAKCSQMDLPYKFQQLDGGDFTTNSSYGSIQMRHFSGIGVTGRKSTPRSYCAHLYHTMKQICDWRYYFVITQDLDAKNKVVKEHYGHFAQEEATLRVGFGCSKITLDLPVDGLVTKDGWRITPRSYPTISRKDADQFKPGQWIPECQLIVQWEKEGQRPARLRHKVDLLGAKPPWNYFYLTLNPTMEVRHFSASSCGSMDYSQDDQTDQPTLIECISFRGSERRISIPQEVGTQYSDFGLFLLNDDSQQRIKSIAHKYMNNAEEINKEVLEQWISGRGKHPVTWKTLTEVLHDIGLNTLASEIEAVKCMNIDSNDAIQKNPSKRHAF